MDDHPVPLSSSLNYLLIPSNSLQSHVASTRKGEEEEEEEKQQGEYGPRGMMIMYNTRLRREQSKEAGKQANWQL